MGHPNYDYCANTEIVYGEDFHGCEVRISGKTNIYHKVLGGNGVMPTVRSYRDGIKVGCTFVTNDAVERIYQLHQSFLSQTDSKTHQ